MVNSADRGFASPFFAKIAPPAFESRALKSDISNRPWAMGSSLRVAHAQAELSHPAPLMPS